MTEYTSKAVEHGITVEVDHVCRTGRHEVCDDVLTEQGAEQVRVSTGATDEEAIAANRDKFVRRTGSHHDLVLRGGTYVAGSICLDRSEHPRRGAPDEQHVPVPQA